MGNFFTDVIQKDARYNSTNRISDLNLLEPVTRQKVQDIIADAKAHGVTMMVFETYRSQARQQMLFDQHASQLRQVGVHHYGLACDIVMSVNGEPSWKGSFAILGQMAHAHQMIWGGDWGTPNQPHSFRDTDHVQRCSVANQAGLFRGDWYPDATYNPYGTTAAPGSMVYKYMLPMMTGTKVGLIQQALNKAGYTTHGIDNVYGHDTQTAVAAFQKAKGMHVDGEVGSGTAAALGVTL